jgi:hypothetical protein
MAKIIRFHDLAGALPPLQPECAPFSAQFSTQYPENAAHSSRAIPEGPANA